MSNVFASPISGYDAPELGRFIASFFDTVQERITSARLILVKPNLLAAKSPEHAVTTHPAFLDAVLKELLPRVTGKVVVGDSPGANFNKYDTVLEATGIGAVAAAHGVQTVKVESYSPVAMDGYAYSSLADEADLIINLPKLKTHSLAVLTLAVKNLFGLIPGSGKVGFHRRFPNDAELARAIYRYYTVLAPKTISILDGILGMEGDGPNKGIPRTYGLTAASVDAVALDCAVTRSLGMKPDECLTTRAALRDGYDVNSITVEGTFPAQERSVLLPLAKRRTLPIPEFIKRIAAGQVYVKPIILPEKCIRCMLCKRSCPVGAIHDVEKVLTVHKKECIECFCCHEVCESDAIDLQRSWLHKVMVK